MYRDRSGNTFVFDSGGKTDGGRLLINGHPVGAHDAHFSVPGDLLVQGTIESSGVILQPIHSAEGSSQSVVTDLDPSTNPLMSKGMLWINKAQEGAGASYRVGYSETHNNMRRPPTPAGQHQRRLTGFRSGILEVQSVRTPVQMRAHWATRKEKYLCGTGARRGPQPATAGPTDSLLMILRRIVGSTNNGGIHFGPPPEAPDWNPDEGGGGHGGNLVILDNKLYAIGGLLALYRDGAGAGAASASVKCFMYDPTLGDTDKWSGIASMQHGRFAVGAAAMGGKIYVLGGTAGW